MPPAEVRAVRPSSAGVAGPTLIGMDAHPLGADLPYGPRLGRSLPSLHRGFGVANRWFVAPMLRAGLGRLFSTPVTGSMLLLRTTGRRSGLRREAPLGYLIVDGAIYCCAGFGTSTGWYRNLLADPRVEVVLPSGLAIQGRAEPVTDEDEWARVWPDYIRSLGVVGRLTLGDPASITPTRADAIRERVPLVRIRPTGLATGPDDPGGLGWIVIQAAATAASIMVLRGILRRIGPARR